jgi:hypothetical protein
VSAPRHCATHSRTAGALRPRKRTVEPSKGDEHLFHARTGPCRDVRSVRRVPSVTIGPVQASPPSRRHPRHCGAIPDAVRSTGRRDAATPAAVPCTAFRQLYPRISTRAATERKTPTPPPSKPLLDGYRTRHDVLPEARFARTTVYSTTLHTMPSHVARTGRHACKLPPPWSINGGAVPWPQGGTPGRTALTHTMSAFTTILALSLNQTSGTWRLHLLSRLACSAPLQAPRCSAIQCLEHTTAGRTAPAGTRINPVSASCLAPAIKR